MKKDAITGRRIGGGSSNASIEKFRTARESEIKGFDKNPGI